MSDRTITLPRAKFAHLRAAEYVWWDDDAGREVLLYMQDARPDDIYDGAIVVELTPAVLDEIEREAEGLLVFKLPFGAEDSSYLVRMETS